MLVFSTAAVVLVVETMSKRKKIVLWIGGLIILGVLCDQLRPFVSFPQQKQERKDTESNSQS